MIPVPVIVAIVIALPALYAAVACPREKWRGYRRWFLSY